MASIVELSAELASQGVRFFPVCRNSKVPAVDAFAQRATSDLESLRILLGSDVNSGIACGRAADDLFLVGLDIDNKTGKPGFETMEKLEVLGMEFPSTWAQRTPSGGEHRLFWSPIPIRQGTDVLGPGVDLRGEGGYLVGPGSSIDGKFYSPLNHLKIARLPDWAVEKYKKVANNVIELRPGGKPDARINPVSALVRCVEYLRGLPETREGNRNQEGYKVVCRLKDLGADKAQVPELLRTYWKCTPMLDDAELAHITNSAYKYGENAHGSAAPETVFEKVKKEKTPFERLNEEHFFIVTEGGSRVGWETKDENGDFKLSFMPLSAFHDKYASLKMLHNDRQLQVTKAWLESKVRRSYDSLCFDPSGEAPPRFYNLWKGWTVEPAPKEGKLPSARAAKGLEMFLEHCLQNVCRGDKELNRWLLGFFAHIFQKPTERPRVSLVFKGQKGAGKNALAECLGFLLGAAFVNISDHKRVFARFNSVLEAKLLVVLDEAFFSGDKSVDGILKSMITEEQRLFERKNMESYQAKVFDRIIIIGNEERLVNATGDERRYAVFDVGNGRLKDWRFFKEMKENIRSHGGGALLLRYLLDFDLSDVHLDDVPKTAALNEQKQHSIGSFESWWHQCLYEGAVLGSIDESTWPTEIPTTELREAFLRWVDREKIRGFVPSSSLCGKTFTKIARGSSERKTVRRGDRFPKAYQILPLDLARLDWDNYMGFAGQWDDE